MSQQPLYYWLPANIDAKLKSVFCNTCNSIIKRKDVIAAGIRSYENDKNIFYVEYKCPNCESRACKLIENNKAVTIESLCYLLLDEVHKKKKIITAKRHQKSRKIKTNKISDQEVQDLKTFMKSQKSHSDFMKFIGGSEQTKKNESE
jgi:hypothetical protein